MIDTSVYNCKNSVDCWGNSCMLFLWFIFCIPCISNKEKSTWAVSCVQYDPNK